MSSLRRLGPLVDDTALAIVSAPPPVDSGPPPVDRPPGELIRLARLAGDPYDKTRRFDYVGVRFGEHNNFNITELKVICDEFYLDNDKAEISLLDPITGEWTCETDPLSHARQRGLTPEGGETEVISSTTTFWSGTAPPRARK